MNNKKKQALIVGTSTAVNHLTSGASLRLETIKSILFDANYESKVIASREVKKYLELNWDLIVVVSFSNMLALIRARNQNVKLWFDATDSWRISRKSMLRAGSLKQIILIPREYILELFIPHLNLVSYISTRDLMAEKKYLFHKAPNFLVFPNLKLERHVIHSLEYRFVFIGDGTYLPNRKAVDFLHKLCNKFPELPQIHVYGIGYKNISSKNLVFHGYDQSGDYFSKDIHVAPIFFGGGIKNKVAIPAANGLQVITTTEGAEGLKSLPNVHIADDLDDFAKVMLKMASNKNLVIKKFSDQDIFTRNDTEYIWSSLSLD